MSTRFAVHSKAEIQRRIHDFFANGGPAKRSVEAWILFVGRGCNIEESVVIYDPNKPGMIDYMTFDEAIQLIKSEHQAAWRTDPYVLPAIQ